MVSLIIIKYSNTTRALYSQEQIFKIIKSDSLYRGCVLYNLIFPTLSLHLFWSADDGKEWPDRLTCKDALKVL